MKNVEWVGNKQYGGNITSFTLTFVVNNGPVTTEVVPGAAGETFLGTDPADSTYGCYHYSADLPVPFVATAGQQYWLSIVADMAEPPQWGWANRPW